MRTVTAPAVIVIALLMSASTAFCSGFALIEQSASGLGTAYSGGAAAAEDATTVFYNPAGMVLLKGQQIVTALHYISPSATYDKEAARNAAGAQFSGSNGGDAGIAKALPNLYYTARVNSDLAMGIGINVPFGLATEYDPTWVGRYHAVKSDVKTININPSIAYRVNDMFSIGAGFNAQYMEAELSSMIDFGLSAFSTLMASGATAQANALAAAGALSNPRADIYGDLKGTSWGYGYNFGFLITPSEATRFGFAYRSQIRQSLKGDATFTQQDPAYLTALGLAASATAKFANQGLNGDITLPASASLSAFHRLNPSWAVMGDISWTQWSSFDKLAINFNGTLAASPSVTTENWRDTWRYSAGVTYNPTEQLTLRSGVAFDQSPVPDNEHRTPRIPDNDRYWLAVGTGYRFTDMLSMDLGYAHLFVPNARINKSAATAEDAGRGTLTGNYSDSVNILSAQLNIRF
jgi:long-chain fatty acid transport protein